MAYKPQLPENIGLVELAAVGSTNDHARQLARNGYPAGTVVWAHDQTAGRGRQGNSWTSYAGNLYMSMIFRPDVNASLAGQFSFLAALALAETLQEWLPHSTGIALKWPNDVLLNGKKAAGILLETEAQGLRPVPWIVVGMGVNVRGAPEGAVSFLDFGIDDIEAGQVLEKLAARLMALQGVWQKNGFAPIREGWLKYAHNIGGSINVRLPKETLKGMFLGIDESGALELELEDGTRRTIASGEVYAGP
jgi:BirA family biotin operon repressor/biotin-[acetyl-CoA-carboxylase] ligase